MAVTLSFTTTTTTTTTSFLPKTPQLQLANFQKPPNSIHFTCTKISCNISNTNTNSNDAPPTSLLCDRRNILIGLGGIMSYNTAFGLAGAKAIAGEQVTFPKALDTVIETTVPRPKKSRTRNEKEEYEEVLNIEFKVGEAKQYITFDVYVNDDEEHKVDEKTVVKAQYAGSFTSLGQKQGDSVGVMGGMKKESNLKLAISRLLEDIGASDDPSIHVTIVPNAGAAQSVVITSLNIQFTAD